MRLPYNHFLFLIMLSILACTKQGTNVAVIPIDESPAPTDSTLIESTTIENMMEGTINLDQDSQAVVLAVNYSGTENNYNFSVKLKSPDTGCDQYADWWEIFDSEGKLLYRRILAHSHVTEQPFTRSGGPVNIEANTFIYIRGHMNTLGYGSLVFSGTINDGFVASELPIEFAADLAAADPLPTNCAF